MSLDKPLISVIMPAYNCENYIKKAIDSILEQSYHNFELLICDDFSNDNTWGIINTYYDKRIKCFRNTENKGYLLTCNFLFERSKGRFITFQDADDYSIPSRLEKLFNHLEKNPQISLIGSNYFRIINKRKITSNFPLEHKDLINYIYKYKSIPFCGASIMIRSECIEGSLYENKFIKLGFEDYYLILSFLLKYQCQNLKEPLYHYTYNKNSITRFFYKDWRKFIIKEIIINKFLSSLRFNKKKIEISNLNEILKKSKIKVKHRYLIVSKFNNLIDNYDFKGLLRFLVSNRSHIYYFLIYPKFIIKCIFNLIRVNVKN